MSRFFVLDAGQPWGLYISPHCYMPREMIRGDLRPLTFDTWDQAIKECSKITQQERKYLFVKTWDDGIVRRDFLGRRLR